MCIIFYVNIIVNSNVRLQKRKVSSICCLISLNGPSASGLWSPSCHSSFWCPLQCRKTFPPSTSYLAAYFIDLCHLNYSLVCHSLLPSDPHDPSQAFALEIIQEGGVKGIWKLQNCIEKHKKPQCCIKSYQNTTTEVTNVIDNVINTSGSLFH